MKRYAVIGLGCIVRGETTHFEHIAREVSHGLFQIGYDTGVPAVLGVITADTNEQAIERAGMKGGGRGYDAAQVAMEMIGVLAQLRGRAPTKKR